MLEEQVLALRGLETTPCLIPPSTQSFFCLRVLGVYSEYLRVEANSEHLQFYSELLGGVSEFPDPDSKSIGDTSELHFSSKIIEHRWATYQRVIIDKARRVELVKKARFEPRIRQEQRSVLVDGSLI